MCTLKSSALNDNYKWNHLFLSCLVVGNCRVPSHQYGFQHAYYACSSKTKSHVCRTWSHCLFFLKDEHHPHLKQYPNNVVKLSSNREASENNHHSANKNKGSKNLKNTKLALVIGKMLVPLGWYPSYLTPQRAL